MRNMIIVLFILPLLSLYACAHRSPEDLPLYAMRVGDMFPNDSKTQALALAASRGDIQKIDRLIGQGADVNATGIRGIPVIVWVMGHPNKAGFHRLLEHGADPNVIWGRKTKDSPLHMLIFLVSTPASPGLDTDYIEMMLQIGKGDPNLQLPSGRRPIEWTFSKRDFDIFAILYNAGAEIDYVDSKGISLLEKAYSDFELIYFMITHGADFNYENKEFNKRSCDYSKSIGSHCLNESGPDVREFNIRGYFSWAKDFYSDKEGLQKIAKDMWFWRCIDFLEKHGMDCRLPPNVDSVRPKVLPTIPTEIEIEIEKWKKKHAN